LGNTIIRLVASPKLGLAAGGTDISPYSNRTLNLSDPLFIVTTD